MLVARGPVHNVLPDGVHVLVLCQLGDEADRVRLSLCSLLLWTGVWDGFVHAPSSGTSHSAKAKDLQGTLFQNKSKSL